MEVKTVQFVTRVQSPAWWNKLIQMENPGCRWIEGKSPDPHASVILLAVNELPEIRKEELSPSKSYIIVNDGWTPQQLRRSLAMVKGALFLDLKDGMEEALTVVRVALARQREKDSHADLMRMMRLQNRQIQELNVSLESTVQERTLNEADSRKASQKNIARIREIIGFIKELARLVDVADLLPLVRRHVKEFHALAAPLLFVPRGEGFGDLYYMRGSQVITSRVRGKWEVSLRIRVNESEDSRFLANAASRPFGKILRFPLVTIRHQKDPVRSPLLFFEHTIPPASLDAVVESLSEKLQPVSWALDRLVLEQELKNTSRDWEMTFDGLTEPIAILDHDGRVLRANAHWRPEFNGLLDPAIHHLRTETLLYAVEKYPIRMSVDSPPISWVVYLRDETRSQKLKSQVVQVDKMSAIGQLAGHIAHELNNPLTGIRSLTQVLLTEIPSDQQIHSDLNEVEMASARCQGIINNLLDFSKGGLQHKIEITDLNEIAKRTLPFLKSATGKFRSDIQLSETSLPVKVEPHLMQQVIFNLVNNACQAMSDKGEISVRTGADGEGAFLEVSDTGPGIQKDLIERIFEPFFTTKAEGEGTGLGLSLSRDFVRQFGGELECESDIGHGATFRVRLPLESNYESSDS